MIHQIEMNIPLPAVSLNNKLIPVRGRMVPNPTYKKAIEDIQKVIEFQYRRHLDEMFKSFDKKEHFFSMDLYVLSPRAKFFRKDGAMSQGVKDADNCLKVVKDAVFPRGGSVDDCFVKRNMIFSLPYDGDSEIQKVELKIESWSDWL